MSVFIEFQSPFSYDNSTNVSVNSASPVAPFGGLPVRGAVRVAPSGPVRGDPISCSRGSDGGDGR